VIPAATRRSATAWAAAAGVEIMKIGIRKARIADSIVVYVSAAGKGAGRPPVAPAATVSQAAR
jgi:hypothetical protein